MSENIHFVPMQPEHIPLWEKWSEKPYIKDLWFIDGYEPKDYVYAKIKGNGYDFPFIIYIDATPIGYIVGCDLYAYRTICPKPKGLFTKEEQGTFCMDLFIGEEEYLNKGLGTKIVKLFSEKIFKEFKAKIIYIDPATSNKRAIRCYEKAGFKIVKTANDGVTDCYIMKKLPIKKPFDMIMQKFINVWVSFKQWPKSIIEFKGDKNISSFESDRKELKKPNEDPFE